ncbi:lamin tail domain-containing protein [Streptomyces sp. NPDC052301]|uniref:lamin tail domain-containing protein n=1 Tax=Streptomyces sp. NPDC052301 TaxID=3365687 RepID=UPI0037D32BB7
MSVSVSASVRRLTAAAAVVAAVVGATALPAEAADRHHPGRGDVFISDVQHAFPGRGIGTNRSLNSEWVDITNHARRAVNLGGWTLSDEDGHTYTFRHVRLEGGATVRVHTGVGRDTRTDLYQDRRAYVWRNDADTATLRNDEGRFVDDFSWGRDHRDEDGGRRDGGRDHHDGDGGRRDGDGRGRDHRDDNGGRHDEDGRRDGGNRHEGGVFHGGEGRHGGVLHGGVLPGGEGRHGGVFHGDHEGGHRR